MTIGIIKHYPTYSIDIFETNHVHYSNNRIKFRTVDNEKHVLEIHDHVSLDVERVFCELSKNGYYMFDSLMVHHVPEHIQDINNWADYDMEG